MIKEPESRMLMEQQSTDFSDLFPSVKDIMQGKKVKPVDPSIWYVIGGKAWQGELGNITSSLRENLWKRSLESQESRSRVRRELHLNFRSAQ